MTYIFRFKMLLCKKGLPILFSIEKYFIYNNKTKLGILSLTFLIKNVLMELSKTPQDSQFINKGLLNLGRCCFEGKFPFNPN